LRSRNHSLASLLAVLILVASLLAGCGASDQPKSGSNSDSGQAKQEKAKKDEGKKSGGKKADRKTAIGTVVMVNSKTNKFALKPKDSKTGDKPMKFRAGKGAKIMSGSKKAEFSDIKKGKQVKIEYVVKKDKNRARLVQLLGGGGEKTTGGGETTG
jgi:major membrane immunogen (membrane-anchored lipoprotein)